VLFFQIADLPLPPLFYADAARNFRREIRAICFGPKVFPFLHTPVNGDSFNVCIGCKP